MSILVGFYDVIFGYILETLHILVEVVEQALDNLIEHIFETQLHETQMIVFYIMLILGGVVIYLFWKVLVELFKTLRIDMSEDWLELKAALASDWQNLTLTERVVGISAFLVINYLLSFLLF